MTPRPCQQIYVFWLSRPKNPQDFALLSEKSHLHYDYVLLTLCQKIHEILEKIFLPKIVISDFETAYIQLEKKYSCVIALTPVDFRKLIQDLIQFLTVSKSFGSKKLVFQSGTFIIDHKICEQLTYVRTGFLLGTKSLAECTLQFGLLFYH